MPSSAASRRASVDHGLHRSGNRPGNPCLGCERRSAAVEASSHQHWRNLRHQPRGLQHPCRGKSHSGRPVRQPGEASGELARIPCNRRNRSYRPLAAVSHHLVSRSARETCTEVRFRWWNTGFGGHRIGGLARLVYGTGSQSEAKHRDVEAAPSRAGYLAGRNR